MGEGRGEREEGGKEEEREGGREEGEGRRQGEGGGEREGGREGQSSNSQLHVHVSDAKFVSTNCCQHVHTRRSAYETKSSWQLVVT